MAQVLKDMSASTPLSGADGSNQPIGWTPPLPGAAEIMVGASAGVGAALSIPWTKPRLIRAFSGLRPRNSGPGPFVPDPTDHDAGWFGPESVAWRLHDSGSMLVAGMAAFALQSLHPLALAGVVEHGSFAEDFMGRTQRTGEFVTGVVYGTSTEAAARCAQVHRIHRRVVGLAPDGRPYSANDPDLLEWVHVTEYMAIAAASRRFALHPPSDAELDAYVAETARVGEEMGVGNPPRSWTQLEEAFCRFIPELGLGEQGVEAIEFLKNPQGITGPAAQVWRILWGGALACMPPVGLKLLKLSPPSFADVVRCRALVQVMGAILGPSPVKQAAEGRCST